MRLPCRKILIKKNKKNKKKETRCVSRVPRGARTLDPLIKSQLLYQLS